jgi:hypothetical protein
VGDGGAGHTIKKDTRGRCGEEGGDPIAESTREASPLKEINQVVPPNGVKGFANVKLEEKTRGLVFKQPSCHVLNIEEVVMNAPSFDECTLGI